MQQDMRRYSVIFTHRLINPINTKPNATPKDYNGTTVNDLVKWLQKWYGYYKILIERKCEDEDPLFIH